MSRDYRNYCDFENTIADSIDIAAFPINSDYCQCHYYDASIVRCIVTPLVHEQSSYGFENTSRVGPGS